MFIPKHFPRRIRILRHHRDEGSGLELHGDVLELDPSLRESVEGMISSDPYVSPGMELSSSLSHDDVPRDHPLSAELLQPESLTRGVAAIARRSGCLLCCET